MTRPDEYTPSTDEVRADYAYPWYEHQVGDTAIRTAGFDRWLKKHDAEKYDEGYRACKAYEKACWDQIYSVLDDYVPPEPTNPYDEGV